MTKLTTPMFEGSSADEVTLIDAYAEVDTDVKNELVSKLPNFKDNIQGNIDKALNLGNSFKAKELTIQDKMQQALEAGNLANIYKDRIQNALKGDRNSIMGLADDLANRLGVSLSGIDSVMGFVNRASEIIESTMMLYNGTQTTLKGNADRIGILLGLLNTVSGSKIGQITDLGAYSSFASQIIQEMQQWTEPNFLDDVFGATKDDDGNWTYKYDDDYRFEIGRDVSKDLGEGNDLGWLDRLIEHVSPEALLADNPNFPASLLANYVFPLDIVPGTSEANKRTYEDELNKMVRILDKLKPDWFMTTRNGEPVWNLRFLSYASEDAITLFKSNELYRAAIMTAPFYEVDSFRELTLKLYPHYPL